MSSQLKAFRGTLIAGALLLAVGGAVLFFDKPPEGPPEDEGVEKPLFVFEKQDLTDIHVERPDGVIVTLVETPEGWVIEQSGFEASKSQVNRVKHQLHDLTARATVVQDADASNLSLYGLGPNQAIDVTLTFRDGSTEHFKAGDPNPSGVSYYLLKDDGVIYTVKKSAVDYYALELDQFRERRFAAFNAKDADRIEADLEGGRRLVLQRADEKTWDMVEPHEMRASLDRARSLLGRVSVLKADEFHDLDAVTPEALAEYGLDAPRARITLTFGTRPPITLLVGDDTEPSEPQHAWMMLEGEGTVYSARVAFLDDYNAEPMAFRSRDVLDWEDDDVTLTRTVFLEHEDAELVGDEAEVRKVGDVWQWYSGAPVPGSSPKRLVQGVVHLDAEEIVDPPLKLGDYGLDSPRARVTLEDLDGNQVVVLFGDEGASRTMEMDEGDTFEIRRVWVMLEGGASLYLVDASVLERLESVVREQARHRDKQEDKAERQEKIEEAP